MNEQISLNGAPVVGFGDAELLGSPFVTRPTIGFIAGVVGGAVLGSFTKKPVWIATGTVVGGISGVVAGAAVALHEARVAREKQKADAPPPTTTPTTPTSNEMLPGQVWTMIGVMHPTKTWTALSKRAVEDAVVVALSKIGLHVLDGDWSADYTFKLAVEPNQKTKLESGATLPLESEWANQMTLSYITLSPATPDRTL